MSCKYIDAHGHLHFPDYDDDREEVYERMREAGVGLITVGTDFESSKKAVEFAKSHGGVWASVGMHPTVGGETITPEFKELAKSSKVVAVGECGLDYFRIRGDESESAAIKKRQKEEFEGQVQFAVDCDLPLMLHCRPTGRSMDAYIDVYEILRSFARNNNNLRGNVHFFVGDTSIAKKFLSLNFTLSFTGVVTFARDYDEAIRYVPDDMILSETDCPYVTPLPWRGKRNEPTYVVHVMDKLAEIREVDSSEFRRNVVENAMRVFAIGGSV